jgi:general secretion pathway protein A
VVDGLTDTHASLNFGGAHYDIPLVALSRYWLGDYLILWRPQVGGQRPLSLGMHGDEIRWLRRSLSVVQGAKVQEPPRDYYDEELARMVADFQRQHRLNVDGIAGLQTQVVLDTLIDSSGSPMLVARLSGG